MSKWRKEMIGTKRGTFEIFVKGERDPICVTHHYSEFNDSGDYFADTYTSKNKVFLVNLKDSRNTDKAEHPHELSMVDALFDLEAIRERLGFSSWTFAGHSTGGMIGILYAIHFSSSLQSLTLVGTAARRYANSSSECIYHHDHPKFKRMQQLIECLKKPDLSAGERKELSKERTKLSLDICR